MKKFKFLIYILAAIIFVLIGLAVSKGTIFTFLVVLVLIIIAFGVFVIIGIIDLIRKSNHYRIVGFTLLYLIIIPISSVIFNRIEDNNKEKVADKIILELNTIKENEGEYPSNLGNIKAIYDFPDLEYFVDTVNQDFELWYDLDGWHMKVYTSKNERWFIAD